MNSTMCLQKNEHGVNPDRCKMFELTHGDDPEYPGDPKSKQAIVRINIDLTIGCKLLNRNHAYRMKV